jgi:hypothetical protein
MTLAEHIRVSELGVTEFVDGVIPDWLLDDLDDYGEGQIDGLEYSDKVGEYTRDLEIAIGSAGFTMETRAGAEGGNWVTNNVFRWGKGSWKGSGGPKWHFHMGPRRFMVHHLPWQSRTWRMHVTKEIMRSLGVRW